MILHQIQTPTLVLDPDRCRANIQRMADKAAIGGHQLRPHFKTHQSKEVGRWFRDMGTRRITVSSVGMARYFMEDAWDDILIAFPVNIRQLSEIHQMASIIQLGVLVVDHHTIDLIGKEVMAPLNLWIKVDVGTHRTGVNPNDVGEIELMVQEIQKYPQLTLKGFLAHAGHSYKGKSPAEQQQIYHDALSSLMALKRYFIPTCPEIQISLGDTPGTSLVDDFGAVDELRPGNYVFYDLMQAALGACTLDDVAVAMACPVVAVHPERKQWVIYGGAVHFSKDNLMRSNGTSLYGLMAREGDRTWDVSQAHHHPLLISLSQEHGVVQCNDENFHWCKPGDLSLWLPVHSCLTADAMGGYITPEGVEIDHYRRHVYDL